MTGFRAWLRSKISSRSPSPSLRPASPGTPAPPKDGPRPLPVPKDRRPPSGSLLPDHHPRTPVPASQPSSSLSPGDISIPIVSSVSDQEPSPAHPVSTLSETQSDSKASNAAKVDPSQSSTHVAPSLSTLRNTFDTALRLGQSAAEVFPPAKAVIAGVIEISKIIDVSHTVFHLDA